MASSSDLKAICAEARPLIEQQLDLAEMVAALRDAASAKGFDWSQIKALLKAQIQDERDESGNGKRVQRIVEKAEFASAYADMLGLANMNEKKFSANEYAAAKGAATTFAAGEDHDPDSGKHVGRSDDEQRDAARVSSADGRREGADEGDQGQGAGASGIDRHGGPVEGTLARQDEDGRSGHVGREARHEITETDSDAFAAVKGKARLANVDDVEPSLSTFLPAPSSPQADRALEACPSPHASGAAISPAARIPTGAGGHLSEPSPDAGAGQQAADADHRNAKSGQAANSISDADVPAFLLKKAMAENEAA